MNLSLVEEQLGKSKEISPYLPKEFEQLLDCQTNINCKSVLSPLLSCVEGEVDSSIDAG